MSTMIDLEKYLSFDEMKEIAKDVFKAECEQRVKKDFERIISNSAYEVVWSAVDKMMDEQAIEHLKNKTIDIIENLTSFSVFRKPDPWENNGGNSPHQILVDTVKNNRELLNLKVQEGINSLSKQDLKEIAKLVAAK